MLRSRSARWLPLCFALAGCPTLRPEFVGETAGLPGSSICSVAGTAERVITAQAKLDYALSPPEPARPPRTELDMRHPGGRPISQFHIDGQCGPIATTDKLVFAALGGTRAAGIALRGEPGSAIAAFDTAARVDAPAWTLAFDATEWSVITSLAVAPDGGLIVGGTFVGTLRAGARVVSSGGKTDGFVARVSPTGAPVWLIRVGGPGADAVQGVAVAPPVAGAAKGASEQIAIAGTFAPGADLLGAPLTASDDRLPTADGFVAVLDGNGVRRWVQSFGGKEDEAVAGVAIDGRGRIAVAATVRDTVHVNGLELTAQGPSDGLVAWWSATGTPGPAVLIGGADFDGLRAIAAAGDSVLVAGFYAGKLQLGARTLTADGGDDAFIAQLDGTTGAVGPSIWVSGPGREEVTALAALPGGFAAAFSHTDKLLLDGDVTFDAPKFSFTHPVVIEWPIPLPTFTPRAAGGPAPRGGP